MNIHRFWLRARASKAVINRQSAAILPLAKVTLEAHVLGEPKSRDDRKVRNPENSIGLFTWQEGGETAKTPPSAAKLPSIPAHAGSGVSPNRMAHKATAIALYSALVASS